jgi:hypothetical protein
LAFAWHWSALPVEIFGRGIGPISYFTSARMRAGRVVPELFVDLIKEAGIDPNKT